MLIIEVHCIDWCVYVQPRAKRSLASHLSGYKPKRRKVGATTARGEQRLVQGGAKQRGVHQGGVAGAGAGGGSSTVAACQVQVGPSCGRLLDGESPQLSGGGGGGADGRAWGCPCPGSQESIPVS